MFESQTMNRLIVNADDPECDGRITLGGVEAQQSERGFLVVAALIPQNRRQGETKRSWLINLDSAYALLVGRHVAALLNEVDGCRYYCYVGLRYLLYGGNGL